MDHDRPIERPVAFALSVVAGTTAAAVFLISLVVPWATSQRAGGAVGTGGPEELGFLPHLLVAAPFVVLPVRWARPATPVLWAVLATGPGLLLTISAPTVLEASLSDTQVWPESGRWYLVAAVGLVVVALALATVARPRPTPIAPGVALRSAAALVGAAGVALSYALPLAGVRLRPGDEYAIVVRGWHVGGPAWAALVAGATLALLAVLGRAWAPAVLGPMAASLVGLGTLLAVRAVVGRGDAVGVRPGGVVLAASVGLLLGAVLARGAEAAGERPLSRRAGASSG